MSTAAGQQEDEATGLPDLQEKARNAPLTDEAAAHLSAAGSLAERGFQTMRAMVEAAISPLIENNRQIGHDLELTDDDVCRIVWAVRGALDYGSHEVVVPIFERARGEPPHVRNGDREAAGAPPQQGGNMSTATKDSPELQDRREKLDEAVGRLRREGYDVRDEASDLYDRDALPKAVWELLKLSSQAAGFAHDAMARYERRQAE